MRSVDGVAADEALRPERPGPRPGLRRRGRRRARRTRRSWGPRRVARGSSRGAPRSTARGWPGPRRRAVPPPPPGSARRGRPTPGPRRTRRPGRPGRSRGRPGPSRGRPWPSRARRAGHPRSVGATAARPPAGAASSRSSGGPGIRAEEQVRGRLADAGEPGSLVHADRDGVVGEDPEIRPFAARGDGLGRRDLGHEAAQAAPARPPRGADGGQVARPFERRPPGCRGGDAVDADEVLGEPRVAERRDVLGLDHGSTGGIDVERVDEHLDDGRGGGRGSRAAQPGQPLDRDARWWRRRQQRAADGTGSTSAITQPGPMSRKPLAASRATRSVGASWAGDAQMCGRRPIDAKRTRISVRRRSKASAPPASGSPRAGSRTARSRPGRAAGSHRPGRAGRGSGWHGPALHGGAGDASSAGRSSRTR